MNQLHHAFQQALAPFSPDRAPRRNVTIKAAFAVTLVGTLWNGELAEKRRTASIPDHWRITKAAREVTKDGDFRACKMTCDSELVLTLRKVTPKGDIITRERRILLLTFPSIRQYIDESELTWSHTQ